MNVLVLGSGGREHAITWKISKSPHCKKVYVAPGNSGTASISTNLQIDVNDFVGIKEAVLSYEIDMVVVGPEDPLVNGIHDFFLNDNLLKDVSVIGPQKAAAQLEGSKDFAKQFLLRHNIPTAAYRSFNPEQIDEGYKFLESLSPPYVLKADGLASGKGVLIIDNIDEAKLELNQMLIGSKFGTASEKVVIEEFLDGLELSCFVLTDGESYKILPTAKDYKRIGEGDLGLNTGGMGAISPAPFVDNILMSKIESSIIKPTIDGLKKDNIQYKGFIFIGLILVNNQPMVIEYNVRMGDPETEAVIPRIDTDLMELLISVKDQTLDKVKLKINCKSASAVVLVSGGYPENYEIGKEIFGLGSVKNVLIFHAGAKREEDIVVTSGGRVIVITAIGDNFRLALKKAYHAVSKVHFDGMNYRRDLGFDL